MVKDLDPYTLSEDEWINFPRNTFNFIVGQVFTRKGIKNMPDNILRPFCKNLCIGLVGEICRLEIMPLHIPTVANLKAHLYIVHPDYDKEPYLTDWLWHRQHLLRVKAPHVKEKKMTYRNGRREKRGQELEWEVMRSFGGPII